MESPFGKYRQKKSWVSLTILCCVVVVCIKFIEYGTIWPVILAVIANAIAIFNSSQADKKDETEQNVDKKITDDYSDEIKTNLSILKKLNLYIGKTANFLILNANDQSVIQRDIQKNSEKTNNIFASVEMKIKEADKASASVRIQAEQGRESMRRLSETLAKLEPIQSATGEFGVLLDEMSKKLESIGGVLFATRIIGFNASIEAARAGEHGRTFGIVANEVGGLANQIEALSNDIKDQLRKGMDKVNQISSDIKLAVEDSANLIRETKSEMEVFIENIKNVLGEVGSAGDSLAQYGDIVKMTNSHLEQITKVSNAIGAAAANVRLVEIVISETIDSSQLKDELCHEVASHKKMDNVRVTDLVQ